MFTLFYILVKEFLAFSYPHNYLLLHSDISIILLPGTNCLQYLYLISSFNFYDIIMITMLLCCNFDINLRSHCVINLLREKCQPFMRINLYCSLFNFPDSYVMLNMTVFFANLKNRVQQKNLKSV